MTQRQPDQVQKGLAYRLVAYCKRDCMNMFYLISFQPDKVVLDGDVK